MSRTCMLKQKIQKTLGFACRPYAAIADVLSVNVGMELLEIVPGRVSTEVDAHLSYDTQKTVDKVNLLVDTSTGAEPSFFKK